MHLESEKLMRAGEIREILKDVPPRAIVRFERDKFPSTLYEKRRIFPGNTGDEWEPCEPDRAEIVTVFLDEDE